MRQRLYTIIAIFLLVGLLLVGLMALQSKVMNGLRAFVAAEAIYSKAQKDAVIHFGAYLERRDPSDAEGFHRSLEVNRFAKLARKELDLSSPDRSELVRLMTNFGIVDTDIKPMIWLYRNFWDFPHMSDAVTLWEDGDRLIDELRESGMAIFAALEEESTEALKPQIEYVYELNRRLQKKEVDFSLKIAEAARRTHQLLLWTNILVFVVLGLISMRFSSRIFSQLVLHESEIAESRKSLSLLVAKRTRELEVKNRQLERAQKKAEESNRAKSEFLAKMSHEIRTPMNAIIGMTHLAREGSLDPKTGSALEKIELASKIIVSLLNDILDLSKVEAGKLTLSEAPFDITELIETLRSLTEVNAREKDITLSIDKDERLPALFVGDPHCLGQILTNLLNNAIKFTDNGGNVALKIMLAGSANIDTETVTLHFCVKDNGIGISQENIKKLFQPYSQLDKPHFTGHKGTGLGLMISKQLVELMGGQLRVESSPGKGSEFHFLIDLPAVAPQERTLNPRFATAMGGLIPCQPKRALKPDSLSGYRVLVVEDNEINREIAVALLEREGMYVNCVENGKQAVDLLENSEFDVILMDCQMPVMDGFEATRQIRKHSKFGNVPILALTANVTQDERRQMDSCGMDDVITKPIDVAEMFDTLKKWLLEEPLLVAPVKGSRMVMPQNFSQIDMEAALKNCMGDANLLVSVLGKFVDSDQNFQDRIKKLLAEKTYIDAAREVHTLKDLAGTLGLHHLVVCAGNLETALRQGTDDIDIAFQSIARSFAEIRSEFTEYSSQNEFGSE